MGVEGPEGAENEHFDRREVDWHDSSPAPEQKVHRALDTRSAHGQRKRVVASAGGQSSAGALGPFWLGAVRSFSPPARSAGANF